MTTAFTAAWWLQVRATQDGAARCLSARESSLFLLVNSSGGLS
jgi:hypothetical protein